MTNRLQQQTKPDGKRVERHACESHSIPRVCSQEPRQVVAGSGEQPRVHSGHARVQLVQSIQQLSQRRDPEAHVEATPRPEPRLRIGHLQRQLHDGEGQVLCVDPSLSEESVHPKLGQEQGQREARPPSRRPEPRARRLR